MNLFLFTYFALISRRHFEKVVYKLYSKQANDKIRLIFLKDLLRFMRKPLWSFRSANYRLLLSNDVCFADFASGIPIKTNGLI